MVGDIAISLYSVGIVFYWFLLLFSCFYHTNFSSDDSPYIQILYISASEGRRNLFFGSNEPEYVSIFILHPYKQFKKVSLLNGHNFPSF